MKLLVALSALCLSACGGAESIPPGGDSPTHGFDPAPVAAGYTRFVPPSITLAPGEEGLWCQWVAGPADEDRDIVDVTGLQSEGGHHAVLYATTDHQPVGTTRPCEDTDQLSMRFLGGIGGEGATSLALPEGAVFRLKQGRSLLVNTHYVNTTAHPIEGRTVVDARIEAPSPDRKVAAFFSNTVIDFSIPPHAEASLDVSCPLPRDVQFVWWANHMHRYGETILSERLVPGSGAELLKLDEGWQYEWAFNPPSVTWPVDAPLVMKAGETLHTRCTWNNGGPDTVTFPHEMCIGIGFFLGESDVTCLGGTWLE